MYFCLVTELKCDYQHAFQVLKGIKNKKWRCFLNLYILSVVQTCMNLNLSLENTSQELQYPCYTLRRGQPRENSVSTSAHQVTWASAKSKRQSQSPRTLFPILCLPGSVVRKNVHDIGNMPFGLILWFFVLFCFHYPYVSLLYCL